MRFIFSALISFLFQIALLFFLKQQIFLTYVPQSRQISKLHAKISKINPEKKKQTQEENLKGQVVDLNPPEREKEPPPDARYLSQYNTRVEKEVKAKHPSPNRMKRKGKAVNTRVSEIQSENSNSISPTRPGKEEQTAMLPNIKNFLKREDGEGQESKFESSKMDKLLVPSTSEEDTLKNIQTITGGFASDDAIIDLTEEGDENLLNSKKFKYWDFFQKLKEKVRKEWTPQDVYKKRDPYGKIYGIKDRFTVLKITLTEEGSLKRLELVRECGIIFLDEEAKRAFKMAQPFPNPPKGLMDKYNEITFNFGFLFEISSSSFRYFGD
jgi:TonB family protein